MTKTPFKIYAGEDLSETQVYVTIQTFDRCAQEYADKWEWNPKTVKEIQKYNINPFLRHVAPKSTCLIAGCQSGRDYSLLSKEGLRCIGVSDSFGLLYEAQKRVPEGIFMYSDLRGLPFMPESFDSVYADALVSIPRRDIKDTLKDFKIFLKENGILYLSLKIGKPGMLLIEDLEGKRYHTLYTKSEILQLIKDVGLEILWSEVSENTDPNLPKWYSLIAQKNS
jgi:SAM-dependent methyltransferase